ncbi:hypothetical protein KSP39_PZI006433 [Platanthera zijinensis]|uniref:Uncharacterized protein n=1 Tax=Platanthera zijinensis TaxID=2320716 RepID=A0AAP0G9L4_9ASPA
MEAISVGPWGCQEGTPFCHRINNGRIQKLLILYEGGFKSLTVKNATETTQSHVSVSSQNHQPVSVIKPQIQPANIIKNSDFRQPIDACWWDVFGDCEVEVISGSTGLGFDNENYVIVSKRKDSSCSIVQDIAGEVCVGGVYKVLAHVSVKGGNGEKLQMRVTVQIKKEDSSWSFLHIGR